MRGGSPHFSDAAHEAVYERVHPTGIIYTWNRAAEILYGWSQGEAVGRVAHDLLRTDFPAPLAEIEGHVRRTGRWDGELVHRRRDGTAVTVASSWTARHDRHRATRAHVVFESDLTYHNLAQAATNDLRQTRTARWSAEKLVERLGRTQLLSVDLAAAETIAEVGRACVQHCPRVIGAHTATVLLLDAAGRTLESIAHLGYPLDQAGGWRQTPVDDHQPIADAFRQHEPIWITSRMACAARYPELVGALEWIDSQSLTVAPLMVAGRPIGVLSLIFEEERSFGGDERRVILALADQVAVALDRVRRLAAGQTAEQELRRRETVFVTAVHDLKAPLTGIRMAAQLLGHRLQRGASSGVSRVDELTMIDSAVTRMIECLDEILDLTRLHEQQSPTAQIRGTDLVELVRRMAATADQSSRRITVHAEPEALVGPWTPALLERMIGNLLDNALKYSPGDQAIEVTVTREAAPEGAAAIVRVRDHGVGIPQEDVPRIFDAFRRGANVVDRIPGSGLGLSSVWRIVHEYAGTVEVSSVEGQGTTFTARLPLSEIALPPETSAAD